MDEGERVKANQPLAELDPQDVRLQLDATRAQVAAGQANLNLVRAERDRYKTLLDRQMVSRSQFDNAENLYRSGEAKLQQLKAEQDVASNQASYAVLRAPQDGVIAQRQVEVGQVVSAGQTVFTLAADGEREVLISLPEQDLAASRSVCRWPSSCGRNPASASAVASANCRLQPILNRAPLLPVSLSLQAKYLQSLAKVPVCLSRAKAPALCPCRCLH
ncbi:MAG: hypothetical protein ACFWUJ_05780 [Pseudomonas fragi]